MPVLPDQESPYTSHLQTNKGAPSRCVTAPRIWLLHEPPQNGPPAKLSGTASRPPASVRRHLDPPQASSSPANDSLRGPDFDGVWKETLRAWLPGCIALFWPDIHQHVDWATPPDFLDKELKRLDRLIKQGNTQHVDLLVRLRLKTGAKALLLLHLEVQAGHVRVGFPRRMFRYHIRLFETYPDHTVLSCAIFLDREHGASTETFQYQTLGCELLFRFPVMNLAQWRHRVAELNKQAPTNPFAVVVLAQLECRATTASEATRLASKLQLARSLKTWRYDEATRKLLFCMLDNLLVLPEALDDRYIETLEQEDSVMMQQLTSLDRVLLRREKAAGIREGELKGERKGERKGELRGKRKGAARLLQTQLERKFGPLPDWAATHIDQANLESLQQWAINVLNAQRIEDVF